MWGSTERLFVGLFTLIVQCLHIYGNEFDLTVEIGAGREDCFFEKVTKPMEIDVEYQVMMIHRVAGRIMDHLPIGL